MPLLAAAAATLAAAAAAAAADLPSAPLLLSVRAQKGALGWSSSGGSGGAEGTSMACGVLTTLGCQKGGGSEKKGSSGVGAGWGASTTIGTCQEGMGAGGRVTTGEAAAPWRGRCAGVCARAAAILQACAATG